MNIVQNEIDYTKLPKHVAITMDGNGRWAKEKGSIRLFGHKQGVDTVNEIVSTAAELGIKYLTLYTFSTENWNRPKDEVFGLMDLLVNATKKYLDKLLSNNVRLSVIGDFNCRDKLFPGNSCGAENSKFQFFHFNSF